MFRKYLCLPMEHSNIQHALTASATRSNETGEETGQVIDVVRFRGNWAGQRPGSFPRKLVRSKTCPVSSHQTQQVQEKSAYHYRVSPREICRIFLISRAKLGVDTSIVSTK